MIKRLRKIFNKPKFEDNYFTNISEISVFNWSECAKGDLRFTRIDAEKGNKADDTKAWHLIHDSYLNRYGLGGPQTYILDLENELAILRCDLAETGDRFLINKITVLISDIEEIVKRNKSEGTDLATITIIASKWVGYKLSETDTTVKVLHDILDLMKNEYKQNKATKDGNKKK